MPYGKICANLPVSQLSRAIDFYAALGFTPHPVFRGPDCQCLIVSDHIHVMVHLPESLRQFTPAKVAEPKAATGVVLSLDCGSRAEVESLIATAVAQGGATYDQPLDLGFIYTHGFTDPDGNVWRLNHFNPDAPLPG